MVAVERKKGKALLQKEEGAGKKWTHAVKGEFELSA